MTKIFKSKLNNCPDEGSCLSSGWDIRVGIDSIRLGFEICKPSALSSKVEFGQSGAILPTSQISIIETPRAILLKVSL